VKLSRKNVVRRKNANIRQIQQQQLMEDNNKPGLKRVMSENLVIENRNKPFHLCSSDVDNGEHCVSDQQGNRFFQISLLTNASYRRVYCTIRQTLMNNLFISEFTNPLISTTNWALNNVNINVLTNSVEHILDDEVKFGQLSPKSVTIFIVDIY